MTTTRGTIERVFAVVTDAGKSVTDISAAAGVHPTNVRSALRILVEDGRVFTCGQNIPGTKHHFLLAFVTEAARDAKRAEFDEVARAKQRLHSAAYKARVKRAASPDAQARKAAKLQAAEAKRAAAEAKRAEAERRANERMLRAAEAEQAKQRARLDREAAAAAKQRAQAEAKSQREALRAQTKALGKLGKQKGTASPAPATPRGPAHIVGELDLSKAKVYVAPPMPDRLATSSPPRVVASNECRRWAEVAA